MEGSMKKTVCRFGSVAVLLCVLTSNSVSQGNPSLVVKQRERYTLSIALEFVRKNRNVAERALSMISDIGPNAYATGFIVGDGLVMTAYHVVSGRLSAAKRKLLGFKPDDELEVRAYVGGCPAKVVKIDKDADLALLSVCGSSKDAKRPTFQLAPAIDEQIILIAQPHESKFLRKGVFQGPYIFQGKQYWSIKVDAFDGFSGSPVYNHQGEVIGVFCGYDSTEGLAFISPGAKAQRFLAEWDAGIGSTQ
jgi:S1-C subfamily serine protease